jgi:hypothetical protein
MFRLLAQYNPIPFRAPSIAPRSLGATPLRKPLVQTACYNRVGPMFDSGSDLSLLADRDSPTMTSPSKSAIHDTPGADCATGHAAFCGPALARLAVTHFAKRTHFHCPDRGAPRFAANRGPLFPSWTHRFHSAFYQTNPFCPERLRPVWPDPRLRVVALGYHLNPSNIPWPCA